MSGITRIDIKGNFSNGAWRQELARSHAHIANNLYRAIFSAMGQPLADGDKILSVDKHEAQARYDWSEGIDVILTTADGLRCTMQEKFLTFKESTATFETVKGNGQPGAWSYCTAQYYFVGYSRRYRDWRTGRLFDNPVIDFQDWVLIDYPAIRRADKFIRWQYNQNNGNDNRYASFKFVKFNDLPSNCVISRK
jgi:hypothetical protein